MKENKKIVIFLTALILVNLMAIYFFIGLRSPGGGDTVSYHDSIKFILGQGEAKDFVLTRMLTSPLMLCLSAFFSFFTKGLYSGMMAVNLIFYFLIVFVFYFFVYEIYESKKISFWATILFASNYYLINPDNAYLVDFGGWFFMILASYFAVRYYKEKIDKYYYFSIFSSVIGFFFKEFGALGLLTLFSLILLSDFTWKEKIKKILGGGLFFAILPVAYHIFFYLKFDFTYFGWYAFNTQYLNKNHNFIVLIKVLGWVYSVGWLIFFYGIRQEFRHFDKTRFKILISLLPASLAFLIWPGFAQRVSFILVPFLTMISGRGLEETNKYLAILFVIIYIVFNYNIPNLINIINLPI